MLSVIAVDWYIQWHFVHSNDLSETNAWNMLCDFFAYSFCFPHSSCSLLVLELGFTKESSFHGPHLEMHEKYL